MNHQRNVRVLSTVFLMMFIIIVGAAIEAESPGFLLTVLRAGVKGIVLALQAATWVALAAGLVYAGIRLERRRWNRGEGLFTIRVTGTPLERALAHHELDERWDRAARIRAGLDGFKHARL